MQKKRLSDGIYWYGLETKKDNDRFVNKVFVNAKIIDKPVEDLEYKKFLEKREKEVVNKI